MPDAPKQGRWSYRNSPTGEVMGPFDLVELAAMLRTGDIMPETDVREEGEEAWMPFNRRREFEWARDMPPGVIMRHLDAKAEKPEPWYTARRLYYLGAFIGGLALYTVAVFAKAAFLGPYIPSSHHHDGNISLAWLLEYLLGHKK